MQLGRKTDRKKVIATIIAVLLSALSSYYVKSLVSSNQDAINLIASAFSILAGFLTAIITLVGDPKSLPSGSWRKASLSKNNIRASLYRHALLLYLYLISIALIITSLLVKNKFPSINNIIEYSYVFFGTGAMIFSFFLPSSLLKAQFKRLDDEIESRKSGKNETNESQN